MTLIIVIILRLLTILMWKGAMSVVKVMAVRLGAAAFCSNKAVIYNIQPHYMSASNYVYVKI